MVRRSQKTNPISHGRSRVVLVIGATHLSITLLFNASSQNGSDVVRGSLTARKTVVKLFARVRMCVAAHLPSVAPTGCHHRRVTGTPRLAAACDQRQCRRRCARTLNGCMSRTAPIACLSSACSSSVVENCSSRRPLPCQMPPLSRSSAVISWRNTVHSEHGGL